MIYRHRHRHRALVGRSSASSGRPGKSETRERTGGCGTGEILVAAGEGGDSSLFRTAANFINPRRRRRRRARARTTARGLDLPVM